MWIEIALIIVIAAACILTNALLRSKKEIIKLTAALVREKRKRSFPLLMLDLNVEDKNLFLFNDSYCYAKNVAIQDMDLIIHLGFQKHLTLKFDEISLLKPGERVKLTFQVFDHGHNITSPDSPNLVYYFPDTEVNFKIDYENIEKDKFTTSIYNEKEEFIVKEAKPVDEENRNPNEEVSMKSLLF